MNQKQNNQAKKLWKDIKTHKNNRQQHESQTAEHYSMPDPVKKQSQPSKGKGFYSNDFMREDDELKHLQDRYSVPNQYGNSPEINEEVQQINIEQALQANNQDSEAFMIFGKGGRSSQRNSAQNQKELLNNKNGKKRVYTQQKKGPIEQEFATQQIQQIQYLTEVSEQPMIHSMTDNKREQTQIKKKALEKMQRVREKVRDLNSDMRNIYQQIEQSKFEWENWISEKFSGQISTILQNTKNKISGPIDHEMIDKLKGQIRQIQESSKVMVALLQNKLDEQIRQNNLLGLETDTLKQKINYLEKQLDSSQDQNLRLNEQLFDSQQRIAQIDLQIEERLRQLYLREGNEKAQNMDKQHYLKQIKQLEANLQMISQKYQMQSGQSSSIKKMKEMEEELNEKQYALKVQEEEIEANYVEIENKKNQLNLFFQQLKLKQAELRFEEKKLVTKLEELEDKETQLLKISEAIKNNKKPDHDFSYQGREDIVDSKNYYLRDEVRQQSPKYEMNYRHREDLNMSNRKDIDYQIFSQKSNSRSRDTKNAYRSRHKYPPAQPSRNTRQRLGQSGAGVNRSRASSSNTRTNNRLHDLGSKLERLREEIRKQIHEAR